MSAELLRRAADLIEQRAAEATSGEWAVEDAPDGFKIVALGPKLPEPKRKGVRNPRRSTIDVVQDSQYDGTGVDEADLDWIATLGPQVAAPLAEWLRESATELELRQVRVAGLNIPQQDAWAEQAFRRPIAFARAVLGEQS